MTIGRGHMKSWMEMGKMLVNDQKNKNSTIIFDENPATIFLAVQMNFNYSSFTRFKSSGSLLGKKTSQQVRQQASDEL